MPAIMAVARLPNYTRPRDNDKMTPVLMFFEEGHPHFGEYPQRSYGNGDQ